MSEQLENFIKNHKNEFDVFEPSTDLWEKLDKRLEAHQKKSKQRSKMRVIYSFGKVAAILLIVLSFGFIWGYYKQQQATNLASINPEYAAKEVQFSSLIEVKRSELKDLKSIDPNLYKTFKSEQDKLEREYQSLKKQLVTTPNQDKIVKAMIRNLQSQISLLNQQLDITKEVKQIKSKQNGQSI
ncbi:MAG: hypothetical protein IE931_02540 [Sphingobacteriales bacterium]|nr:hypothetical protein [Sphingobacteriales bacterium]